MNTKQIKYFEIVSDFFASDVYKQPVVDKYFGALIKHDYAAAEDLWEFMLIKSDKDLNNSAVAALYLDRIFELFLKSGAAKAQKTVLDRPVIERAVFEFSPSVAEGELFAMPLNLLIAGKTEPVDSIFRHVAKNGAPGVTFGGYMIKFLDRFFIEMMKKSAQRRVKLNNKQFALLQATVQRVKGDERAMLIQRVKEVQ